jgi:hypothetical protein
MKQMILLVLGIVACALLLNPVQAVNIPPTPAISKIITDNGTIQSMNYSTTLSILGGNNTKVLGNNITKTITIYGMNGTQGIQGVTGPQGPIGLTGPQGPTGPAGPTDLHPIIVNQTSLVNQTSNIGLVTLYTPNATGTYRVSVYQVDTQSSLAGTLSTTISWIDDSGTQTQKPAGDISLTLLTSFSNGISYIEAKTGTNITYQTTLSGVTGTPKYSLYITVERLL